MGTPRKREMDELLATKYGLGSTLWAYSPASLATKSFDVADLRELPVIHRPGLNGVRLGDRELALLSPFMGEKSLFSAISSPRLSTGVRYTTIIRLLAHVQTKTIWCPVEDVFETRTRGAGDSSLVSEKSPLPFLSQMSI